MDNFMIIFLFGLIASVPFWFVWRQTPRNCPICNSSLPLLYAPWRKTRRQWVQGGYVCKHCNVEVDLQGHAIASDSVTISNRVFFKAIALAVLGPILAVAASGFVFLWGKELVKQQK